MQLTKAHFAVRHAASKDETRYNLNGVRIEADGMTIATNGHILLSASGCVGEDDYVQSVEPTLLELASFDAARKGADKESPYVLEQSSTLKVKGAKVPSLDILPVKDANDFPNWRQVVPNDPIVTVRLGVGYLLTIAKALAEATKGDREASVKLEIRDELTAVKLTSVNSDGTTVTAIIAPTRL